MFINLYSKDKDLKTFPSPYSSTSKLTDTIKDAYEERIQRSKRTDKIDTSVITTKDIQSVLSKRSL